jgi:ribosomal protein S12 methylthiotransferase
VKRIRAAVPGIALRTTFIVGFPGETQKEFQFLLDGIEELQFERMGAFEYSVEEGTPAGEMDEQVAKKTKAQRWRMLMEKQAKISEKLMKRRVGKKERVIVERFDEESGMWAARSQHDAPNVDGRVMLANRGGVSGSSFCDVTIKKAAMYDAFAE